MAGRGALWCHRPRRKKQQPVSLEQYRQYHESDQQWMARKEFLTRFKANYPGRRLDQLLALSMVWSNHVFMRCRYGEQLMQNVLQMAEGIDIGEMPSYELVPSAKGTKRSSPTAVGEEPSKKQATAKFCPRPHFSPVHFVVSTTKKEEDKPLESKNGSSDGPTWNSCGGWLPESSIDTFLDSNKDEGKDSQCYSESQQLIPFVYDPSDSQSKSSNESGSFMAKMEQNYSAKFESHCSTLSKDFRSNVLDVWKDGIKQGRKGFGFKKTKKGNKKVSVPPPQEPEVDSADPFTLTEKKQTLIKSISVAVVTNLFNPAMLLAPDRVNYTQMLTRSIQSCKANPEYCYVPFKEMSPADRPKNKKLPADGFACELRCQNIYLSTGYSGSKNGARDRATEQAVKLLTNPVEVKTVQRRFGNAYRDDLVVCRCDVPTQEFPPALKPLEDPQLDNKEPTGGSQSGDINKIASDTKSWTDFILTENASDAIGILNNSANVSKMPIEYKFELLPTRSWCCRVFMRDYCLAEGFGNKKNSKHAAAEEAVKVIRKIQSEIPNPKAARATATSISPEKRKELKDVVIYENSNNALCTLNDTAQFNKVTVEYVFERLTDLRWKCKVFLDSQYVAEAIDVKKSVKHIAAEEAVRTLKKTQPVVVNNLRKGGTVDEAISRSQIRGEAAEEAYRHQIKEDNIGNQLLRKMGWKGGGLGKEGEGIAEPIYVKEQYAREGLGLDQERGGNKISKRDIEQVIRNYACSYRQDDLTFAAELNNEERKQIHHTAHKYGLKSKSHGQGGDRFLVVSRKRRKEDLIDQLKQEGQVGRYALVMPDTN